MSDQFIARPLPKHRTTQTQNKHINTPNSHALSGIRTHDPSFRASENSSCLLRPLGYCETMWSYTEYLLALHEEWKAFFFFKISLPLFLLVFIYFRSKANYIV
jgi:hypothetical protein